jgi:hypothetical protein
MTNALASDMVRKSLDVFIEGLEGQQPLSPEEARLLLESCDFPALFLERLWRLGQEALDRGMEARQLVVLLNRIADVFARGVEAFDVAEERVGESGLAPEVKELGLANLRRASQSAAHRRDELLALVRRLEARPRQVDPTALPAERDAPETKGYVDLDDVVSRLLSRGDA